MTRSQARSAFHDALIALALFGVPYGIWRICT